MLYPERYASFMIMPKPKSLPNVPEKSDSRVRPRSVHFLKDGAQLIVSYLNHGIV